jgi:hypothetical protein
MKLLGWDRTPIARRADNFADRATPSGEFVRPVERLAKGILLSQHATAINQCHSAETIHLDGGYGPDRAKPPDLGGSLPSKDERTPAKFDAFVKAEIARWSPILKAANVEAK